LGGDTKVETDEIIDLSMSNVVPATADGSDIDISDTGTITITNDDQATVTIADVSGNEDDGAITVTVTLDVAVDGGFDVDVSTADGTATIADSDYAAITNQTLTFAGTVGEMKTFTVTPTADGISEGNENLTVSMSNLVPTTVDNGDIDITDGATVTINEDDAAAITVDDPTVNEGTSGTTMLTFTVSLSSAQVGTVTVDVATSDGTATAGSDYTAVGSTTITFNPGETSKTVDVTIAGDEMVEVDETITLTLSNNTGTSTISDATGTGTITNDDQAIVTIADISEEESGTFTLTLVSDKAVDGGFTVDVNTADNTATAGTDYTALASETVTFAGTAGETETVIVTVADDDLIESDELIDISMNNLVPVTVDANDIDITDQATLTIQNNDVAGFTVTPTSGLITTEAGGTDEFDVVLDAEPNSDVVITVSSGDSGEATVSLSTLTFTAANWDTPQTVTVTGQDDNIIDGDQTATITLAIDAASTDDNFDAVADQMVDVTNNDNDVAGFTVNPTNGLVTTEGGGSDSFDVVLDAEPASDVVITVTSGDTGEATVDKATLTFTTADWDEAQTVTVTGVDDNLIDGAQSFNITLAIDDNNSDDDFDNVADETVGVENTDNDVAGFTVTPTSGLITTEAGGTDEFEVVLDAEPNSDVVITVSSGDTGEATVSLSTLTFTAANWDTPQTVTVTGQDDDIIDGPQTFDITLAIDADNSDDNFDALTDQTVSVDNTDNDVAGFAVTQSAGTTATDEDGTTDSFTVVLDAEPASDVVITVTSGDTGEATVDQSTLTFTAASWNTPQTVTVTGVADNTVDLDQTFNITLSIDDAGSDDDFDGVADQTVSVENANTDQATVSIADVSGNEDDGAITVTVTLDIAVVGGFDVDVSTVDGTATIADNDYTAVANQTLTFAGTAGETETFMVMPTSDATPEADETLTVSMSGLVPLTVNTDDIDITDDAIVTIITDDDGTAPEGYTVTLDDALIGGGEVTTSTFTFADAEVGATYDYEITDGTTTITGTGTIATATDQVTLADLSSLKDGTLTLSVTLTDAANNKGIAATDDTELDATAPSAPVVTGISDDTGSSDNDGITNDTTPDVNGTAEANSTVELFVDGNSVGTTVADASGKWKLTYNGTNPLSDGTISLSAEATDAADNTSSESVAVNVTIDSTAPDAPELTGVTSDTGSSDEDGITSDNTLVFVGTAETNSIVEVFIDGSSVGTATTDDIGDWSFDYSATTLADADYVVSAKATDAAGNESEPGEREFIIDSTAPVAPTIDLATSSDTGVSDTDNLTSDRTPTLGGTAEANSTVEILNSGAVFVSVVADASGNWSYTPPPRPQGVFNLSARSVDVAGNTGSASEVLELVIDFALNSPGLSPSDNSINVLPEANLVLTFNEDINKGSGSLVIRKSSDNSVLETIDVSSGNVSISGEIVTIDPENAILPPATEFYVTLDENTFTDDAGNGYAGISNNTDWTFTTIEAPVVTAVSVPAAGTYGIGEDLEFEVNFSREVTMTGSPTIDLFIGSKTVQASLQAAVTGSTTATFHYAIVEGDLDTDGIMLGTSIDLNTGTLKDAFDIDGVTALNNVASTTSILVDGVKPVPTITSTAEALTNAAFTVTFTYNEEVTGLESGDITVTNGVASDFTSVTAGTVWSATITPAADGVTTVTLNAGVTNDLAGNASKAGNTVSTTFDGTAPTVTSITRAEADQIPTGTASRDYTVVFSEDVTGVDVTDFEVVTTGTATASVNTVTPVDASTYTVNVNGISGEGTIGLNARAGTDIADAATNALAAAFTGDIYTTNFAPTDISLTTAEIQENNDVGEEVATLSTTDADAGDSFTYSLVSGNGSTDNASFTINGDKLQAAEVFDFETKDSYSIRIRTQDGFGGSFEESLIISITNEGEADISIAGDGEFDQTVLGLSSTKTWTATNNGDAATELRVVSTAEGFSITPVSVQVNPGETKSITAVFSPIQARVYTGVVVFNFDITADIQNEEIEIALSGEGVIVTGVDNGQISEDAISVFPNPASNYVTIDLSELNGMPVDIQMINPTGVSKLEKEDYDKAELTIDVTNFESGLYIIRFGNDRSLVRKKVLIRK
jgi:hypothetical protein